MNKVKIPEAEKQLHALIPDDSLGPCGSAIRWLRKGGYATLQEAWEACQDGDWMLWYLDLLALRQFPRSTWRCRISLCLLREGYDLNDPVITAWNARRRTARQKKLVADLIRKVYPKIPKLGAAGRT